MGDFFLLRNCWNLWIAKEIFLPQLALHWARVRKQYINISAAQIESEKISAI